MCLTPDVQIFHWLHMSMACFFVSFSGVFCRSSFKHYVMTVELSVIVIYIYIYVFLFGHFLSFSSLNSFGSKMSIQSIDHKNRADISQVVLKFSEDMNHATASVHLDWNAAFLHDTKTKCICPVLWQKQLLLEVKKHRLS